MNSKESHKENSPEAGPSAGKRSYAAVLTGTGTSSGPYTHLSSEYQAVGEDEAIQIATERSRQDVQVHSQILL